MPDINIAKKIVQAVQGNGLDGIAFTDHYSDSFGRGTKELIDSELGGEIVVIPGRELDIMFSGPEQRGIYHLVELFLPGDITFRFIAHPGHPYVSNLDSLITGDVHGIELKNPSHLQEMDQDLIRKTAEKHNLILLTNSDAHSLDDIGTFYNEIEIEQLCSRATS